MEMREAEVNAIRKGGVQCMDSTEPREGDRGKMWRGEEDSRVYNSRVDVSLGWEGRNERANKGPCRVGFHRTEDTFLCSMVNTTCPPVPLYTSRPPCL